MASLFFSAYRLASPLQPLLLRLFSSYMPRLKTFVDVRKNLFSDLENRLKSLPKPSCRLWVHASSVGEFEQARPVISELRKQIPGMDVVVSFLSDSGYEARKNYPDAAAVFYLPLDTPDNARRLTAMVNPDIFLLMRYDFWPNHLSAIRKSGAAMVLAASTIPNGSVYLKWKYRGFYRELFSLFDLIFTINSRDCAWIQSKFRCQNVKKAGDPRFDQVFERKKNSDQQNMKFRLLFRNRIVLIGGSTWEPDESILIPAYLLHRKRLTLVLVPHKVDHQNIDRLMQYLRQQNIDAVTISAMNETFDPTKQVLVVDQTGYLAELYAIASIAYVGGGFGVNVHNTIEPAAYAIPVIFGPKHDKSPEAAGLIKSGGGIVVSGEQAMCEELTGLMENAGYRRRAGHMSLAYVRSQLGATTIICDEINHLYQKKS
jgi:3-deoxy-D-manno-octulosonic-acid transferase